MGQDCIVRRVIHLVRTVVHRRARAREFSGIDEGVAVCLYDLDHWLERR